MTERKKRTVKAVDRTGEVLEKKVAAKDAHMAQQEVDAKNYAKGQEAVKEYYELGLGGKILKKKLKVNGSVSCSYIGSVNNKEGAQTYKTLKEKGLI